MFTSYAQNLEDVMLYRALKHVTHGIYVDVGAQDPVADSVTKAFYDRGWHGVNIEPVTRYFENLERLRPRDSNVQAAMAEAERVLKLFEVPGTGLSTIEAPIAERHAREGFDVIEREIRSRRLDDICAELELETIHFLKVDVEGAERRVLDGLSLGPFRPWIVVIEATAPLSATQTHEEWEHLLLGRGYSSVHFDGLNRFYVADEHAELADAFRSPPNDSDDFVRYSPRTIRFLRRKAQQRVKRLLSRLGAVARIARTRQAGKQSRQ